MGKQVMVDKPVCLELEVAGLQRLQAAELASGRSLTACHNSR